MASILSFQGIMVFATAAMAVSGSAILLGFRFHKSFPFDQIPQPSQQVLRSCMSSGGKIKRKKKTKKKKVQFAEEVMDPRRDGKELIRKEVKNQEVRICSNDCSSSLDLKKNGGGNGREMPANRVALYNGILRARAVQRLAYSC